MDVKPTGNVNIPSHLTAQRNPVEAESPIAAKPAIPSAETASTVQQPVAIPNMAQVAQAVKSINKAMQQMSQNLEFSIDTDSNRTIVKVVDQTTKEVLRQIPSEEILAISKALDQTQGLLIRQKA
ncbi:MAG TPA: flagellar protein FlaG [Burkholderiaceae bacterium]|nr:flagellar protein FlaG [Burkholderiaceae bacterium]